MGIKHSTSVLVQSQKTCFLQDFAANLRGALPPVNPPTYTYRYYIICRSSNMRIMVAVMSGNCIIVPRKCRSEDYQGVSLVPTHHKFLYFLAFKHKNARKMLVEIYNNSVNGPSSDIMLPERCFQDPDISFRCQ